MPKFNFGLNSELAQQDLQGFYTGDCPPKGNYTAVVKQFKSKPNRNGDQRLNLLLEVTEPDGSDKTQYNGYGIWNGLNVTDSGVPWINNMLDGVVGDRVAFYAGNVVIGQKSSDGEFDILKIGNVKPVGRTVRVFCKVVNDNNGNPKLEVSQYLTDEDEDGTEDVPEDISGLGETDAEAEAETETEDEADDTGDSTEEATEGYTQEELEELDPATLRGICDDWEVAYAAKATKATLIKAILNAQEVPEEDEATEETEDLTEEDLDSMGPDDLKGYMKERGWEDRIPNPFIPSRVRKLILQIQQEPPF